MQRAADAEMSKATSPADTPVILRTEQITKVFPGTMALDHVDFNVYRGKVNALIGENGAGKSTLMNILMGLYPPDAGEIRIDGAAVHFHSPRDAVNAGLGMVHQHFTLVENMTVWENIILGKELCRGFILDKNRIISELQRLLDKTGFEI